MDGSEGVGCALAATDRISRSAAGSANPPDSVPSASSSRKSSRGKKSAQASQGMAPQVLRDGGQVADDLAQMQRQQVLQLAFADPSGHPTVQWTKMSP